MKCFYCDKEISPDKYVVIALDKPYVNLNVHLPCMREIEGLGTQEYLQNNIKKINAYIEEKSSKENKPTKRGK